MKKQILLLTALCSMSMVTVNAQMQYNKKDANIGFDGQETLENGNFKLIHSFNLSDAWRESKKPVTEKLSSSNGKGIYGMAITTEDVNSNKAEWLNNGKTENSGSNLAVVWVPSAKVLRDSLSKDDDPLKHEYWKAACCLWDVPGTGGKDQAFTIWPGMAKRRIMGFQVKAQDQLTGLLKDIQFDLLTLDKGTTGKSATYKMILDLSKQPAFPWIHSTYGKTGDDVALLDSISEDNVSKVNAALGSKMYVKDNVYVSSLEDGNLNRITIKLAEEFGLKLSDLRGKKIMVTLYSTTSGTAVQPGMYEPIVGIDNVTVPEYGTATWLEPAIKDGQSDTVTVDAYLRTETPLKFKLKGQNRLSALTLISDGDTKASTDFIFASEGAIMSKDAEGNYTIPVTYKYVPTDGSAAATLTIAANANGESIDDDLEVTLTMKPIEKGKVRNYRLEVNNGTRFWKQFKVNLTEPTSITTNEVESIKVITSNRRIFVENATENVAIYNDGGQLLKSVSADEASKGIAVENGIYLVRTGDDVEKVFVK